MNRLITIILGAAGVIIAAALLFAYSGIYNIAADEPHSAIGDAYIETLRERSIASRSSEIAVPDISGESLLTSGAEHYDAMCTGCHLAPGMQDTELRQGLSPTPPNFAEDGIDDRAEAFWVIKHGIKLTGMPAWGGTHDDESLWGLVALAEKLPEMSASDYANLVARAGSGGHDHGPHDHGSPAEASAESAAAEESGDRHADTSTPGGHSHAAPDTPAAVLDAFHHALEEGKGQVALSYLADNVLILEGAHIQTRDEYAGGHLGSDLEFLSAVKSKRLTRKTITGDQQVTILTQSGISGTFKGKAIDIASSESAVLEKRPDGWRIVHLHWSS
jgi:mono/diheme cytochrome c family protein